MLISSANQPDFGLYALICSVYIQVTSNTTKIALKNTTK